MKHLLAIAIVLVNAWWHAAYASPLLVYTTQEGQKFFNSQKKTAPPGMYLALRCANKGCRLQRTRLVARPEMIDVYGADVPENGYLLRSYAPGTMVFLRGIPGLKEGPLRTWYFKRRLDERAQAEAEPQWVKEINAGGTRLRFNGRVVEGDIRRCSTCKGESGVIWDVELGGRHYAIATIPDDVVARENGRTTAGSLVLWVGDLDRDGKPDFLIRPQARYDGIALQLFLSTALKPGRRWMPTAAFDYWPAGMPDC